MAGTFWSFIDISYDVLLEAYGILGYYGLLTHGWYTCLVQVIMYDGTLMDGICLAYR